MLDDFTCEFNSEGRWAQISESVKSVIHLEQAKKTFFKVIRKSVNLCSLFT